MSYSHTGAPTEFNGTNPITGGDSGEYNLPWAFAHVPSTARASRATFRPSIFAELREEMILTQQLQSPRT
jgi:hypothetical protein